MFVGDMNNIKQAISTVIQNRQIDLMEEIAELTLVYIMIGNHDTPFKHNPKINSLKSLGLIQGVQLVDEPVIVQTVKGESVMMIPWIFGKDNELKVIKENDADYLIAHTEIAGFHYEGVPVSDSKHNQISDFAKFKRVWSGHIHKYQEKENILFIGTPFQTKKSEINNKNGIHLIDFETGEEKFLENKISPTFKRIDIFTLMNMKKSEADEFVKNSYVTMVMPSELMYKINTGKLNNILEGYRSLEPQTITTKSKQDLDFLMADHGLEDIDMTSSIKDKLMELVDDMEGVRLKKDETILLTDELRHKFKRDLGTLYTAAEKKEETIDDFEV